ncbi:citryl-CoA lyase [Methanobacterium alcaliphilum]|uniref:citryl-CoA lyase n=1 Tax=Methanobacterium alcaliphilum TaxID=392018 RepID=UPI002009E258|nr:citryl-CoA lyase [Methanobacterium alcaliphilum]MCK9152164.1 citryl-CoA lyase [Methanobacterium alcaliphilum]
MISENVLKDIFKPNNLKWRTAITKVEPNRILTRGYLQEKLIGNISFAEMVYLLVKGELPSKNEAKMLESVLISFCDHGVTPPSTQAARLIASAGSPLNTCITGGLLAFGKNHAGAIEFSMEMLQEGIQRTRSDLDIDKIAQIMVAESMKNQKKIPGFGHRYHTEDPRAPRLMELAQKNKCFGRHCELALEIENILFESKDIRMNIDGANAGILSDLGFDWRLGSGIFMIGRLPGLMAHVHEEISRDPPFRKIFHNDEIYYDGEEEKL